MLQRCVVLPSTRPWIRFASQSSRSLADDRPVKMTGMTSGNAESVSKPSSILSRLSDRTQAMTYNANGAQRGPGAHVEVTSAVQRTPHPRATSFVSARSAQKRDRAAEKWFANVREVDVNDVDQPDGLKSLPRKTHTGAKPLKQHEMRPRTDLNALFSPSTVLSAASLRLQTKRELGGDYASYLPGGYADPYRHPIAYARLILVRNKHIPLTAQTDALGIIEEAIRGKMTTRQVV